MNVFLARIPLSLLYQPTWVRQWILAPRRTLPPVPPRGGEGKSGFPFPLREGGWGDRFFELLDGRQWVERTSWTIAKMDADLLKMKLDDTRKEVAELRRKIEQLDKTLK
jgi:hypothetical protein